MQHMPENCPISVKKWWRLRNSLENGHSDLKYEIALKSSDAKTNVKSLKNNNVQTIPLERRSTSSQENLSLFRDFKHQETHSSSNAAFLCNAEGCSKYEDTPINLVEDSRNQYPPDMLKFPESNIHPETYTNINFLKKPDKTEMHKEKGGRECHLYSHSIDETWNRGCTFSQITGDSVRSIIVPSLYSSTENRDIPPLIRFVSYYDFEKLRFLQYNNSHSMYGTEEIKYHLTRKDENQTHLVGNFEDANCNKQKVLFNRRPYLSNNLEYDPHSFVGVPKSVIEWPVAESCKDTLVEHLTAEPVERPHVCHVCGKAFGQKRYLLNHLSVHSGEKRYLCDICQKNFSHKSNLVKHLKVHSGERPYSCHVCDKRFVQKIHLVNHMTVHSGERPYVCHICQKRFSYKSNLVKHIKLHSGKKPFACSICDKRFTQKVNLVMHQKLHEKGPFTCVICQKKFLYESSLAKHIIAHNGEKPYSCNICDKKFIQKANLAKHLKVHKIEMM